MSIGTERCSMVDYSMRFMITVTTNERIASLMMKKIYKREGYEH